MSKEKWTPAKHLIAVFDDIHEVNGWTYRGIGIRLTFRASPKGRRPSRYVLTHLGSGHRVFLINVKESKAFEIATDLAECVEWDWGGLDGYKNIEPNIKQKLRDTVVRWPGLVEFSSGNGSSSESAHAIAEMRA